MKKTYKTYTVTGRLKYPSWGNYHHTGYEVEVCATSKSEAIRYARIEIADMGYTKVEGPIYLKAVETD